MLSGRVASVQFKDSIRNFEYLVFCIGLPIVLLTASILFLGAPRISYTAASFIILALLINVVGASEVTYDDIVARRPLFRFTKLNLIQYLIGVLATWILLSFVQAFVLGITTYGLTGISPLESVETMAVFVLGIALAGGIASPILGFIVSSLAVNLNLERRNLPGLTVMLSIVLMFISTSSSVPEHVGYFLPWYNCYQLIVYSLGSDTLEIVVLVKYVLSTLLLTFVFALLFRRALKTEMCE